MHPRPLLLRRCRRTDFEAVRALFSASDVAAPAPERAALRRFRRMVSDLGSDLYLAFLGGRLAGLVHVTYHRHLIDGTVARIELLIVAPDARRRGVGTALTALARERARRRGCRRLHCAAASSMPDLSAFLARGGWRGAGEEFQFDLGEAAQ